MAKNRQLQQLGPRSMAWGGDSKLMGQASEGNGYRQCWKTLGDGEASRPPMLNGAAVSTRRSNSDWLARARPSVGSASVAEHSTARQLERAKTTPPGQRPVRWGLKSKSWRCLAQSCAVKKWVGARQGPSRTPPGANLHIGKKWPVFQPFKPSLEQLHDRLGLLVGLRQHGGGGLLNDL